ncbi:MAG TPA: TlyA family RNA methyltransferase [Polyangiaceae bacterium]|nr:TlyA family RNA methyltransferase [Polyangiaceae bacterium]
MTQRDKVTGLSSKDRVDLLLVERGLAPSRAKAQALVLAGQVFSGEQRIDKPGQTLPRNALLRVQAGPRYVSRGGDKLEGALVDCALSVEGSVCVDVGASTGGFTDCLLQHGAARVYAVDVGEGQLAQRLTRDARVVVMDRTNARHLAPESFPERIDLAVVDASFIGIELLAPALARILPVGSRLLALVKPQFEAGRREATRGRGVIRDPALRAELIERASHTLLTHGFELLAGHDCRVRGPKGNLEHFLLAKRDARDQKNSPLTLDESAEESAT